MISLPDCKTTRLEITTPIKPFDCKDPDLNQFLFQDAQNYLKELLGVTYLFEYGDITVAFFTVSNDKIVYSEDVFQSKSAWKRFLNVLPHKKRLRELPAVKIGRLGVDAKFQGNEIGTQIIDFIKMFFVDKNKTGCRFITVDAYNNPRTLSFYEKNGFQMLTETDESEETRLMYFDLMRFIRMLPAL
jgi:GNAT superfamily N-acetyltransferase